MLITPEAAARLSYDILLNWVCRGCIISEIPELVDELYRLPAPSQRGNFARAFTTIIAAMVHARYVYGDEIGADAIIENALDIIDHETTQAILGVTRGKSS